MKLMSRDELRFVQRRRTRVKALGRGSEIEVNPVVYERELLLGGHRVGPNRTEEEAVAICDGKSGHVLLVVGLRDLRTFREHLEACEVLFMNGRVLSFFEANPPPRAEMGPTALGRYSPETIRAYEKVIRAGLGIEGDLVEALRELGVHVHCDLAGEVRDAHVKEDE